MYNLLQLYSSNINKLFGMVVMFCLHFYFVLKHKFVGMIMHQAFIFKILHEWLPCNMAVGSETSAMGMLSKLCNDDAVLDDIAVEAVRQALASVTCATSVHPTDPTLIRAALLQAWQQSASDPDKSVPQWLQHGAPVGIASDMPHDGSFVPLDIVQAQMDEFSNYKGVEEDGHAESEIAKFLDRGYLKAFDIADALVEFVGALPIYNKVGIVTKTPQVGGEASYEP